MLPTDLPSGTDVIFRDVAGRLRRTRTVERPVLISSYWMVQLEFGRGLFDFASVRLCTPAERALPLERGATAPALRKLYAGIASTSAPDRVAQRLAAVATALAHEGYRLRTRGAVGAETSMTTAAALGGGGTEIWLPSATYNRFAFKGETRVGPRSPMYQEAEDLAISHSEGWSAIHPDVRRLYVSGVLALLGDGLNDPCQFVIAWSTGFTLDGDRVVDANGGAGLAVRIAASRGIRTYHLAHKPHAERLGRWVRRQRDDANSVVVASSNVG